MDNLGLGSWIARRARMTPGDTAVISANGSVTYEELNERVTRLAHALHALGVARGDSVAYLGPNHPAFLETLFATGTLGAIFVPLNARLAAPELVFVLSDSQSSVLVHAPEQAEVVAAVFDEVALKHVIAVAGPSSGAHSYAELLAAASTSPIDETVSPDDTAMIMYTSGTTGRPKGAMLSHANATWNAVNVIIDVDVASNEVSLVSAPLFHTAALNMLCLPTLMKGGTAVLMQAFEPARAFDLIEAHRVTWMFGVPTMFQAMAQSPRWEQANLSSVRILMCGGAPVPQALIRTYQDRGLTFLQGYGMTETAPGALFLSRRMASKVGSAGKASFFTDVRLVRPDWSDVAAGEPGEIVVKGPNVMQGYWRQPEATAASVVDGWFRSGDIGVRDGDGFFYVQDRIKDMIISGGENIYPAEVEAVFYQHPAVAECAVIGVPDDKWGEVGKAIVVMKSAEGCGPHDLLGFCAGKLAKFKIPKWITFVDTLPRTGSGKVDKLKLRKTYGEASGDRAEPEAP
jgi:fatty-acyl-CoA synthase